MILQPLTLASRDDSKSVGAAAAEVLVDIVGACDSFFGGAVPRAGIPDGGTAEGEGSFPSFGLVV